MDIRPTAVELTLNQYDRLELYIVNSLGDRREEEARYSFYDTLEKAQKLADFLGAKLVHDFDLSDTLALMKLLYSHKGCFNLEETWRREEKHLVQLGFSRPMIRDALFPNCVQTKSRDNTIYNWASKNIQGAWMTAKTRYYRKYWFERTEDATLFKVHWLILPEDR